MRGATVTKETVIKVKSYLENEKYKDLSQEEIGTLAGVSASTVSRVLQGAYDDLVNDPVKNTEDINVSIDYETLKHLLACEYAVEAILKQSTLSNTTGATLFVHYNAVFGILKAYVPEDVEHKLTELKEKEDANE